MVMKTMRKQFHLLKWVIYAVVAAFVLSVGLPYLVPDQAELNAPALVNGEPIDSLMYNRAVQGRLSSLGELYGSEIPGDERRRMQSEVLDDMIDSELALQGAEKMGLAISDTEYQLIVQNESSFKDPQTGVYDQNRYVQFLNNSVQQGLTVEQAELNLRRGIMLSKARSIFGNSANVSQVEIDTAVASLNRSVRARSLYWDFDKLGDKLELNDEDIRSYYSKNKDKWKKEEQVKARHILIKTTPGDTTATAKSKARADDLYAKIVDGASFATLAIEASEDEGSAKKGGDLGFFEKKDMVPAFADKAFSQKTGDVSKPVLSRFGWHIIKNTDRKKGFEPTFENSKSTARKELREERARTEAGRLAHLAIRQLEDGKSLEEIAKTDSKAGVLTTDWFKRDDKRALPGAGEDENFADQALLYAKGQIPQAPINLKKGTVVAMIIDEKDGKLPTDQTDLADQRRETRSRLQAEKGDALYKGWIKSLRADAEIEMQRHTGDFGQ